MGLSGLLRAVSESGHVKELVRVAREEQGDAPIQVTAPSALLPFLAGVLATQQAGNDLDGRESDARPGAEAPVLVVTPSGKDAEDLANALGSLLNPDEIAVYPAWETLPHERLSPRSDTIGKRLAVLRRLAHPSTDDPTTGPLKIVVAPVRSVLQPQPKGLGELAPVALQPKDAADLDELAQALALGGYERVDLVGGRGEFAVRGGILDVFPPTEEHPLRVELFGDEVDEVRYFSVADQRSLEIAPHGLWAPPCRELLLTDEVRDRAAKLAVEHPELAEMLEKIAGGAVIEGMESLTPALLGPDQMELMLAAMPRGTQVIVADPEKVRSRAHDLVATSQEFLEASWAAAAIANTPGGAGRAPIDVNAATFVSLDDVFETAHSLGHRLWLVGPLGGVPGQAIETVQREPSAAELASGVRATQEYRGEIDKAVADIAGWQRAGWATVLVFAGHGSAQRAGEQFSEAGLGVSIVDTLDTAPGGGTITVTTGLLLKGLIDGDAKVAVLTETDLTGSRAMEGAARKMPSRRRNVVDLMSLRTGDYVVHEQHGVGRYIEMVRRTLNGADREYLVIEYAASKRNQPADRLFVPTDQLDLLTRYVGGEQPTVHRIGGADWQKAKGRARKAVREIAGELIRLYAARVNTTGHAFGPDTPWQRELEDAFPFTETPDQLAAIDEVKVDMSRPHPMDRVICGDVGYGKTEIAIRAAFKAVQDGKQVAVLVPTTLLARQHFGTFTARMTQFPVKIAQLSRFQSDAEVRETLAGMADGTVDIVIGTHRLLQSNVRFKDLGLVVVDEEQRFGVEHKEHLKHLRTAVDVLTMSATPIPRTLEMSMTGIREMSTIATPPEERHPVLTYVGAHDDKQITAAIRRELIRDGQVFFLHNRVDSIDRAAAKIRALVPEARVEVGHGQMGEDQLERVMVGFWEKQYDVLVCTTIVESGLDIPNANTLIVERADRFGLSQLHQIRGRVGRGRERGYAYFLYPPEQPLTETAYERLATIAQHTELGAGMYVAMKDLEIRGAGNMLGGEQSGHIASVGFDLYVRMVSEAVAEFKGEKQEEPAEIKVDLPVDANVPPSYIDSERLRLELYRKLAGAQSAEELSAIREEVLDRYGLLPEPVENLFAVAEFRVMARSRGLTDIGVQGKLIRLAPLTLLESKVMRLQRLYPGATYKQAARVVTVPAPMTARVGGKPIRDRALLTWCTELLTVMLT